MSRAINIIALVVVTVVSTLFIANIVSESLRKEERAFMPESLMGKWVGEEYEGILIVRQDRVEVIKRGKKHVCNVEKVSFYYHGAFFAYLVGVQGVAAVCDGASTDRYQTCM